MEKIAEPLIARLVGEGQDKPQGDQELPIDINYKRLLDWLTSRHKLPKDWSKLLAAIQAKATECFKELRPEVVAKLKGGPDVPLDYFRAVEIRDLLAQTSSERTIFGGLTGDAATWDKIVKAYEKGGILLGEAASSLVRNAEFELPYLRKQAAKSRQLVEDASRRQQEYTRSAGVCAAAYKKDCEALGIAGGPDVAKELAALTEQLAQHYSQALHTLQAEKLGAAISFYQDFSQYAHAIPAEKCDQLLVTLCEVRDGKTAPPSTTATASAVITQPAAGGISWDLGDSSALTAQNKEETGGAGDISWDVDLTTAAQESANNAAGGISWDLPADALQPAAGRDTGAISWDVGAAVEGGDEQGGGEEAGAAPVEISWDAGAGEAGKGDIDWGIDVSAGYDRADAQQDSNAAGAVQTAAATTADGHAGGAESTVVQRIVADGEYRARLLDDLLELRAFLVQRRAELGGSGSQLLSATMPEALHTQDHKEGIEGMLSAVESALGQLRGPHITELLLLSTSARYAARRASELQRKAGQEAKMHAAAHEAVARGNEAKAQLMDLSRKVAELVERLRSQKSHVEGMLSGMLGGRTVNILGDINTALASTLA